MLHLLDIAAQVPVILTTNRATSLDAAIHRRIVEHIEFPLPDAEIRSVIIKELLSRIKNLSNNFSESDFRNIVTETDGLSPAEIVQSIVDAVCEVGSRNQPFLATFEKRVKVRKLMKSKVEVKTPEIKTLNPQKLKA